jgi:hypothetical protein
LRYAKKEFFMLSMMNCEGTWRSVQRAGFGFFGVLVLFGGLFGGASSVRAAALSSTNVQPATLVTGQSSTVTVSFTAVTDIPADGKIKVTFPSGFTVSGANGATCSTMDGQFATSVASQVVTITRSTGSTETAAAETCTIAGIVNPTIAGSTGTYTIETTDAVNTQLDVDAAVAADTIVAGTLGSTNVQPSSLVAGANVTITATFTMNNSLEANGAIRIQLPSGFTINGGSSVASCSTMDGEFALAGSTTLAAIIRSGGSIEPAGAQTCTVTNVTNPTTAGSTGTYSIQAVTVANEVHDQDTAVTADTITAATLTSTNVQPASLRAATTNTVTVSFTMVNSLEGTGKIKVTFPSGFVVSGAANATCSTMDGQFATSVASQVVTITRSSGNIEAAGAQTCTIGSIQNPSTAGTSGTYTISTTNSSDAVHDTDAAITGDFISAGSSSSSEPSSSSSLTYTMMITAPVAETSFDAGDAIDIAWMSGGTGSTPYVNISYSIDGGTTWSTIATNETNDGSYVWTSPNFTAASVILKVEGTDLSTVLSTTSSGTFSIGIVSSEENDEAVEFDGEIDGNGLVVGDYIKGESWSTVYFIDENSVRRPFLDSQTFFTYADDFSSVVTVADAVLAEYTVGTPMLPKEGIVLVKVQSLNSVYALVGDNTLRWVTTEAVATALYGTNWADYVIDVPATAWGHFEIGENIVASTDITVDLHSMQTRSALNSK